MLDDILKNAILILKTLEDNGYEAYMVGGFPRDYVLGIKSDDRCIWFLIYKRRNGYASYSWWKEEIQYNATLPSRSIQYISSLDYPKQGKIKEVSFDTSFFK